MNKQELIENIKNISVVVSDTTINYRGVMVSMNEVLNIIKQLDEPEKPVVPQFVAEWYEKNKDDLEYNLYKLCTDFREQKLREDFHGWFNDDNNKSIETLVLMHKFGYEVKKEKLYTVELPNPNRADVSLVLGLYNDGKVAIFAAFTDSWKYEKQYKLTEAEIKQDFEWAWQFAKEVEE
ncbi:DUF1642 domain-containing protein [Streptococcus lutetiensis]|uniref:Protein of uncharacterized function (DUF1642) n=1 Tax=Streptococcus lutetiensis TaxID=150055 RepID=A0AB38G5C8_9STRE|nr:DUF1642 domain-containing protein [Streptococcus lutetiensis]QQE30790.1 DUF1642 domain-containing protein [Streptococcus lutetiensis]SQF41996.1 Protein of uncharacterised function (DUF1642) [Streptococcus lutetiensis]